MEEGYYAQAAKQQANGIPGAMLGNTIRPPRTFDQIDTFVTELAELNKRLDCALDRLGHCADKACDSSDAASAKLGSDYSRSLDRLRREINGLRSAVTALETHI